jgi:SAM-dependent methyltransferase
MTTKYHEAFYRINEKKSSNSARAVLSALREIYPADTLLDAGCGIGTWGRAAKELGFTKYRGLDGDYVQREQLLVNREEFTAHDLRQPFALNERYDVALSMEVAEHLPPEAGDLLVKSLCAHAPVIVFSAAIPGQGGVDHVNEQWQSYWAERFAAEGFDAYDCLRPRVWERDDVAEYYKQNVLVYVDRRNEALTARFRGDGQARKPLLDVVHPASYRIKTDPLRWPLGTVVRNFPGIVARVIKNRVISR